MASSGEQKLLLCSQCHGLMRDACFLENEGTRADMLCMHSRIECQLTQTRCFPGICLSDVIFHFSIEDMKSTKLSTYNRD